MKELNGTVIAITGAAQGIGRALAFAGARRGARLALADLDAARLEQTAAELAQSGATVSTHAVDIADPAAIARFAAEVEARHGGAQILINNAGVALMGDFDEVDQTDFEWLMAINFWGTVHATRAFLPQLKRRPWGHLVNLSSVFGIMGPPGQTAYAASKFAVRGFTDALRHELQGSTVTVSVVHPGGIATKIAERARRGGGVDAVRAEQAARHFATVARTSPEQAAERILRGIERTDARILIGADAQIIDAVVRFFPSRYLGVLGKLFPSGLKRV